MRSICFLSGLDIGDRVAETSRRPMTRRLLKLNRFLKWFLIAASVVIFVFALKNLAGPNSFSPFGVTPKVVDYSRFVEDVQNGKIVAKGTFRKDFFEGEYLKDAPGATTSGKKKFVVALPPDS